MGEAGIYPARIQAYIGSTCWCPNLRLLINVFYVYSKWYIHVVWPTVYRYLRDNKTLS
jgi:hypothetical protein